jgi:hypothetical protein
MLRRPNLEKRWRGKGCAVVVLLAVVSLTVNVATRYCSSPSSASAACSARSVHEVSSPERSRQRLTKTSADWMPTVIGTAVLEAAPSYPRIAPAGQPRHGLLLEKSLYNRPPPSCYVFLFRFLFLILASKTIR